MSGSFGWGGSDRRDYRDRSDSSEDIYSRTDYSRARRGYSTPAPTYRCSCGKEVNYSGDLCWGCKDKAAKDKAVKDQASRAWNPSPAVQAPPKPAPKPAASVVWQHNHVPVPPHSFNRRPHGKTLKSTAKAVIQVVVDVTGSIRSWVPEIFRRLPLMFGEAQKFLGDDLQILFITYGDVKYGDVIEVIDFASGPLLDDHLEALNTEASGGGDGEESPEIVAHWLLHAVDTGSAKHVFTFFITDEAGAESMASRYCLQGVGISKDEELDTAKDTFSCLRRKGEVFTVLAHTADHNYYVKSCSYDIDGYWNRVLGSDHVLPLHDQRRVVDVMLGAVAKVTSQYDTFTQALSARQAGTRYTDENLGTVHASLSMVPGGPSAPPPDPRRRDLSR